MFNLPLSSTFTTQFYSFPCYLLITLSNKILNTNGYITQPCLSLLLTSKWSPHSHSYLTHALLSLMQILYIRNKTFFSSVLILYSHSSSLHIQLYAFSKSVSAKYSSFFVSLLFSTICFNTNIRSSQTLPCLNSPSSFAI